MSAYFLYIGQTQVDGPFDSWSDAQVAKQKFAHPDRCKVGDANRQLEEVATMLPDTSTPNESHPDKSVALAHWDGLYPPPAAIRCLEVQREQPSPNTSIVSMCMLLEGHDGACRFRERHRVT